MFFRLSIFHIIVFGIAFGLTSCIQFPPPLPEQEQEYILPEITNISVDQTTDIVILGDTPQQKTPPKKQFFNPLDLDPLNPYYCSNKRLDTSIRYLENAKKYLKSYYTSRQLSQLFFAWYASEDSVYLVNTVKRCSYKKNMHFYAVRKIHRMNVYLQKDIVRNMREGEYKELGELYMNDYREIFPRDIN